MTDKAEPVADASERRTFKALTTARSLLDQLISPHTIAFDAELREIDTAIEAALRSRPSAVVAWQYEIANYRRNDGSYTGWYPRLDWHKPNVPPESVRNLQPLYASPSPERDTPREEGAIAIAKSSLHGVIDFASSDTSEFPRLFEEAKRRSDRFIDELIAALSPDAGGQG